MKTPPSNIVLSIHQPWAELIVRGVKRFEWRTRHLHVRGPVLIHATKNIAVSWLAESIIAGAFGEPSELHLGGIIGVVDIVGCRPSSAINTNGWPPFLLPPRGRHYGWELARPRRLPFTPCRGRQGFWRLPDGFELSGEVGS